MPDPFLGGVAATHHQISVVLARQRAADIFAHDIERPCVIACRQISLDSVVEDQRRSGIAVGLQTRADIVASANRG